MSTVTPSVRRAQKSSKHQKIICEQQTCSCRNEVRKKRKPLAQNFIFDFYESTQVFSSTKNFFLHNSRSCCTSCQILRASRQILRWGKKLNEMKHNPACHKCVGATKTAVNMHARLMAMQILWSPGVYKLSGSQVWLPATLIMAWLAGHNSNCSGHSSYSTRSLPS